MKKFFLALVAVMLVAANPMSVRAAEAAAESHISVSGTGTVKVKPDIAVLNIGVTKTGTTTAVQQESDEIMAKIMEAVKAGGISETDIQTSSYSLSPNYDYGEKLYVNSMDSTPAITGYTMYHTIEVKVRDIALAGDILTDALAAGANVNNGIDFRLSDPDTYYLQALTKAMANAKAKADTIAAAMGITLSAPLRVTEGSSYSSPYYANYNARTYAVADAAMAAGVAAPVESGMLEVSATVSVDYVK